MWGRGSQLGSGEMAKHKPYKFACSTLRLEGPAVRKCNTKKRKALEDRRADEVKTLNSSQEIRELIESLINEKQKQALQKDENET